MQNLKLIQTEDGSHSLYLPGLKETYHSFHGAVRESIHVYINKGFHHLLQKPSLNKLSVLEVGFGTGLNVLLTIAEAEQNSIETSFTTLEPNPLPEEVWQSLNYPEVLSTIYRGFNFRNHFEAIHKCSFNEEVQLSSQFRFIKKDIPVQEVSDSFEEFDLIYFDAFAPSKQPEIWQADVFERLLKIIKPGGILVTYCAQGQFKRNLKEAGFIVESLQGPPGKKEMIRGIKPG